MFTPRIFPYWIYFSTPHAALVMGLFGLRFGGGSVMAVVLAMALLVYGGFVLGARLFEWHQY